MNDFAHIFVLDTGHSDGCGGFEKKATYNRLISKNKKG
jgi:hypothetical protein